jgi:hypothetical protein
MRTCIKALLVAVLGISATGSVQAHFPWLDVDKEGKAVLFFGETPAERDYKLPESIASAKLFAVEADQSKKPVELNKVETDDFIGLVSNEPVAKEADLASQVTYGIYHGTLLTYHLQHQGKLATTHSADSKAAEGLAASIVDTDSGVDVYVSFNGKPLAKADVKLFCEEGHEEGEATTDKDGKVSFTDKQVEEGLNAVLVGTTLDDKSGELNGKQYKSESHYLTATFQDPNKD